MRKVREMTTSLSLLVNDSVDEPTAELTQGSGAFFHGLFDLNKGRVRKCTEIDQSAVLPGHCGGLLPPSNTSDPSCALLQSL
jgi:hypothetical protein